MITNAFEMMQNHNFPTFVDVFVSLEIFGEIMFELMFLTPVMFVLVSTLLME